MEDSTAPCSFTRGSLLRAEIRAGFRFWFEFHIRPQPPAKPPRPSLERPHLRARQCYKSPAHDGRPEPVSSGESYVPAAVSSDLWRRLFHLKGELQTMQLRLSYVIAHQSAPFQQHRVAPGRRGPYPLHLVPMPGLIRGAPAITRTKPLAANSGGLAPRAHGVVTIPFLDYEAADSGVLNCCDKEPGEIDPFQLHFCRLSERVQDKDVLVAEVADAL